MNMNLKKAQNLLRVDIETLSLEELQRHNVALLTAWRYADGQYGYQNDFFVYVPELKAFVPADKWLLLNLWNRQEEVFDKLQKIYSSL